MEPRNSEIGCASCKNTGWKNNYPDLITLCRTVDLGFLRNFRRLVFSFDTDEILLKVLHIQFPVPSPLHFLSEYIVLPTVLQVSTIKIAIIGYVIILPLHLLEFRVSILNFVSSTT
ncbi:hypothetical protein Tco_0462223 [Tanacetum coccineum]